MRIRTVKPEFFTHEALFEAEQAAGMPLRVAFAGLWCAADRDGRFKWEPRRMGLAILPYDGVEFSRVLDALLSRGFIVKYRVGEAWFGAIPSFHRHQVVNPRERKSELPQVAEADEVIDATSTRAARVATRDDLARGEGKGKGREGKGIVYCPEAPPVGEAPGPEDEVEEVGADEGGDLLALVDPSEPVFLDFPVIGSPRPWPLVASKVAEYRATFVGLEVEAVLRRARQWCIDNPTRRKTSRGMPKFLFGFLERAQNRGAGGSGGHFPPPAPLDERLQGNLRKF
jgi:hypothetical protein